MKNRYEKLSPFMQREVDELVDALASAPAGVDVLDITDHAIRCVRDRSRLETYVAEG